MDELGKIVFEEIVLLRLLANLITEDQDVLPIVLNRIKYLAELKKK